MNNFKVKLILLDENDKPKSGMEITSHEIDRLRKQDVSPFDEMLKNLLDREGFLDGKKKIHERIQVLAKISSAQVDRMDREGPDHYKDMAQIIDENSRIEAISMLCASGLWFGTKEELERLWN
jgi:hypothetical protein